MITLIVAVSKNGVIGDDNKLIWHLPEDLKRFKNLTSGNVVVMGRKTHESIGKVLPNRLNVILTRNIKWYKPLGDNCVVCYSKEEVIERFKHRNIFVIGGGEIYKEFEPYANLIEMTYIDKEFQGDTKFIDLDSKWVETLREDHQNENYNYSFIQLSRNQNL
jgi:dihydrofolate reductase